MALRLRDNSTRARLVFGILAVMVVGLLSFFGIRSSQVSHAVDTPGADVTAPSAPTILTPNDNQYIAATPIENSWTAVTDPSGIANYEVEYIYDDGHTFSGGPTRLVPGNQTSRNHQPGGSEQGGVTIRVRAIDGAGNKSDYSTPVHYYYDRTAPTIALSRPQDGDWFKKDQQFTVSAHLTDNVGLENYRLQIDGIEPTPASVNREEPQTLVAGRHGHG